MSAAPILVDYKAAKVNSGPDEYQDNRVRRAARLRRPKWNPKKWHPVYEDIVLQSCLGFSNIEIAKDRGYTPQHISNILNTPQATIIRTQLIKQIERKRSESIEARLEKLAYKAMDRIEDVMMNDEFANKEKLGIFDRSITVLKSVGKIKPEGGMTVNNNTMIISDEGLKRIEAAFKLSSDAEKLHRLSPGEVRGDLASEIAEVIEE